MEYSPNSADSIRPVVALFKYFLWELLLWLNKPCQGMIKENEKVEHDKNKQMNGKNQNYVQATFFESSLLLDCSLWLTD